MSAPKKPRKRSKPEPAKLSIEISGSCRMLSTMEMRCPLCGVMVPPNTVHHCELKP